MLVAMRAQLELKRLNFYNGPIDGIIGAETRGALIRFQQSQNLAASGVLDNSTLSKLGVRP
jgi:peptidoglycan hydrolase-like protein with peptidoglycan-binding domain